uniref:Uncharacterized protein n=1 Tax=Panagrolaimus sp. ES5 TaxID=591445 RepID=A0AC34EZY9_9BILA
MIHSKRPRKQKIVWDSNDFIARIATDSELVSTQVTQGGNLAGMDKEEELEIDVQRASQAQVLHQLHEIKIPQVLFSETLQSLTRYDVLSNMYALDKEDQDFCEKERINPFYLSWYFTNASKTNNDNFFAPSQLYFVGVDTNTFEKLGQHYERKVKMYSDKFGYETADLAPNIARFRHVTNVPASYTCFFPRPPKVATRRKSQMESKVIEATFQIRQEVVNLHAQGALLITKQLEDMRFTQKIDEKIEYAPKNDTSGDKEPPAKRFKEDLSLLDDLTPKAKQLATILEDIELDSEPEPEECPRVSDEFLETAKKQAAILKVRSLFPELRPRGEQLCRIQQRIKEKNNKKCLLTKSDSSKPNLEKNDERIISADFEKFNEIENDDYVVPAMPFYKKR